MGSGGSQSLTFPGLKALSIAFEATGTLCVEARGGGPYHQPQFTDAKYEDWSLVNRRAHKRRVLGSDHSACIYPLCHLQLQPHNAFCSARGSPEKITLLVCLPPPPELPRTWQEDHTWQRRSRKKTLLWLPRGQAARSHGQNRCPATTYRRPRPGTTRIILMGKLGLEGTPTLIQHMFQTFTFSSHDI